MSRASRRTNDEPDEPRGSLPVQWKAVTLPHAWNEDSAYKVAIYNLPTGIAWYRKHFTVPSIPKEGRVYIEFQGERLAAPLWQGTVCAIRATTT